MLILAVISLSGCGGIPTLPPLPSDEPVLEAPAEEPDPDAVGTFDSYTEESGGNFHLYLVLREARFA